MTNYLDGTPIAQFAIDLDHRVTHWNRAIEKLTGIKAAEMIGTRDHWKAFYHNRRPVLADLIVNNDRQALEKYYKSQGISESEIIPTAWEATDYFEQIGETGSYFYFLAAPMHDAAGHMIGAIETVQDITRRVLAENELRESQRRYRTLTEQVADGVALIQDGRLGFANDAFASIFGHDRPEDLAGTLALDLIGHRDRPIYQAMRDDFQSGRFTGSILELRCIRANGDEFWVETHNNPVTWDGKPALLTTVRDISDRKHRELADMEETDQLRNENLRLKSQLRDRFGLGNIVGRSRPMQVVYENIMRAAASDGHVIVTGESGTGKELVARAIHAMSDRADKKFIAVNCGAIPESLFESEFFGHKKGAFTGASIDKIGYLESAQGGYLLLDEVGEIPLNIQVKLLRVMEGGDFTPVGGTQAKKFDARIIAATNRDLKEMVRKGLMREDFFYRIHIIPIPIPPLRERVEDLPLLVYHFLDSFSDKQENLLFPEKALKSMLAHDWPGNVRELRNIIQRYVTFKTLDFLNMPAPETKEAKPFDAAAKPEFGPGFDLRRVIENFERKIILKAMNLEKGNRTRAAQTLGTQRRSLQRKLLKYQIA